MLESSAKVTDEPAVPVVAVEVVRDAAGSGSDSFAAAGVGCVLSDGERLASIAAAGNINYQLLC